MRRNPTYAGAKELRATALGGGRRGDPCAARMEFGAAFCGKGRKSARSDDLWPKWIELRIDVDGKDWSSDDPEYGVVGCLSCGHFSDMPACTECWTTRLEPSRKVLAYLLTEVFGATHVEWFFSGKKGYHALVLDAGLFGAPLDTEAREKLFDELVNPSCPELVDHIYDDILEPIFREQYLSGQPAFQGGVHRERPIPMEVYMQGVERRPSHTLDNAGCLAAIGRDEFDGDPARIKAHRRAMMRSLYWPRLDRVVTTKPGHLLKLPFCCHESTGNLEVPLLDPSTFVPERALTLAQVLQKPSRIVPYVNHFVRVINAAIPKANIPEEMEVDDDDGDDGRTLAVVQQAAGGGSGHGLNDEELELIAMMDAYDDDERARKRSKVVVVGE